MAYYIDPAAYTPDAATLAMKARSPVWFARSTWPAIIAEKPYVDEINAVYTAYIEALPKFYAQNGITQQQIFAGKQGGSELALIWARQQAAKNTAEWQLALADYNKGSVFHDPILGWEIYHQFLGSYITGGMIKGLRDWYPHGKLTQSVIDGMLAQFAAHDKPSQFDKLMEVAIPLFIVGVAFVAAAGAISAGSAAAPVSSAAAPAPLASAATPAAAGMAPVAAVPASVIPGGATLAGLASTAAGAAGTALVGKALAPPKPAQPLPAAQPTTPVQTAPRPDMALAGFGLFALLLFLI